ncbi:MAG: GspH/FimT family pseudopilin [Gammaproteobacteria bacterium]|jgi:type IV fimbrial biogenesis protein FimT|nr:GspH/FimT family pseudopilin [Gammaproteobacteria bacterium]MDH3777252.1 GspH/FimT family pseudopilin [Gammaproteobacteria bacterium]MDH3810065.1 GspH/FimT family pseudopilin [Gammaproteobacteria bacterium]
MRTEKGFTLIELMIAVGLTGLLLSMAVPALDIFVSNARQTGAINDFVSSIHQARSTAVTTNTRVTICPSAGGTNCEAVGWNAGWIVFSDPDSDRNVDNGERIIGTAGSLDGLTIQSAEFGTFLMYRPNGRVMNASLNGSSGSFIVCDGRGADHAKVMILDLSGRPRLSKTMVDGSSPSCS